jgi:gliding motility-associated-like protein
MKKITLMLVMAFISFCSFAQEGFENTWTPAPPGLGDSAAGPAGWAVKNTAGPIFTWVQGNGSGAQPAHTGSHSAFLNSENVATNTQSEDWLVMPATLVPANGQLRFWSHLFVNNDQGTDYKIMISTTTTAGTLAEQTNEDNFTALIEWNELELNPVQQDWVEKVVSLDAYEGETVYIAFVMMGDNGDRWAIDDVNVVSQCLDPTGLDASDIGLDTATLTWTDPGNAASYDLEILPQAAAATGVPNANSAIESYDATDEDGLVENGAYKFYVRANCGGGNYSNWVGPFNFSTVGLGDSCSAPIEVTTLPYSTTDNTSNYADTNYEGSPGSTGCGVTWGYLDGNNVVYAYEATVTGVINIELSGILGNYAGMFVYDDCDDIGVSCIAGDYNGFSAAPLSIPTLNVTAGTTYYIVISSWPSPQTIGYTLTIQQVFCAPPVNVEITDIGMNSASLSWSNPSGATSWEVVVQEAVLGIPTGAGETTTTNTDYLADGLEEATAYEYYVRAECADGNFSAWAGPYPFNTMVCEVDEQCTYTIVMTDSFGDGWNGNTMTLSQNGIALATVGSTFTTGNGPVEVDVQVCDGLPVQLYWNAGGSWATEVGVSLQNEYGQTFFTKNPGTGTQNSVVYTGTVDCGTVLCLPPTELYVDNVTTTTAEIGWAGPETGNWNYYIVEAGEPAPTEATPGINTTVNPTPVELEQATNYEFYVQMVCEDGESAWAGPYAFSTMVCEAEDQCDYTFILYSDWWGGWYDATMVISQNGTNVATIGPSFTSGQTQTVTVPLCTETPFEVYWEDGGDFSFQVGLTIINGFDQTLFEMGPGDGVVGTVLYSGNADCDTPECLAPEDLYAGPYTTGTAQIGWAGPETGNWEYFIVEAGGAAPTDDTEPTGTTTQNPVTITEGLDPATNYDFYVRWVCEGNGNSDWAGPLEFNTAVCEPEEQCNYIFVLTDSFGDGWNGNTMTVFQAGVPVGVIGPTFTTGEGPVEVEVPMCPGEEFSLFWNTGGSFATEVGVTILTPFAEDVYVKQPGTGAQNTTLYTGIASCTPPACPKPQDLLISDIQLEEVDFSFTEMGSATEWEVIVVPYGSPAPAPDAPVNPENTFTGTGTEIETLLDNLESGTTYQVYVRAICGGEDGNSNWSGPVTFATAIENDDCDGAIDVPVNPGAQCLDTASGTVTGATSSGIASSCSWMAPEWDVWYSFEATGDTHAISVIDQVGAFYYFALFEGDCEGDGLEEVYCNYSSSSIVNNLTAGQTYYIQVYTTWLNGTGPTSFEVCVGTPEPPIYVSETDYTVPELVTEVFLGSECAYVDNVEWVTGTNSGTGSMQNGIGYWESNGSSFEFVEPDGTIYQSGIVLLSGDAETDVPGPNDSTIFGNWSHPATKTLLENVLNQYDEFAGNPAITYGHTSIKFDFSPLVDLPEGTTLFKFLFASEEYGTPGFECNFSDVFAFILTDLETGDYWNLAVLPDGTTLILVTNIHPDGGVCGAANEEYFGQYNGMLSPINFNGQTVKMDAILPVALVAEHEYSMQMIVANEGDNSWSSGVFLLEGSFDLGEINLGPDLLIDDDNAICSDEQVTISTNLDPETHDFEWTLNGEVMDGETGPSITVTEGGVYAVTAQVEGIDCTRTGSIVVEFYPDVEDVTGDPADLTECDADGYAEFDLTENTAPILAGNTNPDFTYVVEYYLTEAEATEGTVTPLPALFTNTVQFQQTIYARVENATSGCFAVKTFDLIVEDNTPQFTITEDFSICEGTEGTITVVPGDFELADVVISWTQDGEAFAGTGTTITVTEAGVYEVSIERLGCVGTAAVTVTVTPTPVAQELDDVTACDSYTLGALSPGNQYFTETNGGGTELFTGDIISDSATIYILASSNTTPSCTSESSFDINIVPSPVIVEAEVADVSACDGYELPELTVGAYFTEANGAGTEIPAGTIIETTTEVFVFASSGTVPCTDSDSFTVTITPTPVAAVLSDVAECDLYELPALPAGNAYYTGPGATGEMLAAGTNIIDSQTIYVYAAAAANAECWSESSFDVEIVPTPEIEITWGCNDLNLFELAVAFDPESNYTEDNVTFSWTNAAGAVVGTQPTLILSAVEGQQGLGAGTYTVTVTPLGGVACPVPATLEVASVICDLPKGISPNGDGDNDSFDLSALDVVKLSIFNRYGKEVYGFNGNYTDEFEGLASSGEKLPTGTYYYMVQRSNGETITGWVYVNWQE